MAKVVFITGASRGIGLATAKKFVTEGWKVAGFYRNAAGPKMDGITYYQVDVADWGSIQKSFDKAFLEMGRIDCLVNCAGIFGYKTLQQYDIETMETVVGTNEMGTYLTAKWAAEKMKQGAMVFVSSTAAQVGSSDPVYAGTKAAVLGFAKSMAKALAPGIRVNCVAPGVTESDMTRSMNQERLKQLVELSLLKKAARPEDIANGIYFLASEEAGHITGICLDINGGYVLR